jgi:hypothetical protein
MNGYARRPGVIMQATKTLHWFVVCALACVACGDDGASSQELGMGSENVAGGQASGASAAGSRPAADGGTGGTSPARRVDVAALEATGLKKYLGAAKPAEMQTNGNETQYFFNEADGPVCLRGGRFAMATRKTDSQDLVIYFQGGGSCRTSLCRATETANPMLPTYGVLPEGASGSSTINAKVFAFSGTPFQRRGGDRSSPSPV